MAASLKHLLKSVFKQESWKVTLLSEWETIVGSLAQHMRIEKIAGSTLTLGVYHAAWMQELYLLSSVIKQSINTHLKKNYIEELRFSLAPQKETTALQNSAINPQTTPEKKEEPLIILQPREEEVLHKIKDVELKKILHKFLSRCHYQKLQN